MKCPLMTDKDYSIQLERKLNPGDCLKEECAWWHTYQDNNGTTHVACVLIHIADKKEVSK